MMKSNIRNTQIIDLLKEELKKPLPGIEAQYKMRPVTRQNSLIEAPENSKNGAVLVFLYEKAGKLTLCFIKRTTDGGAHSGQISFPGGKKEDADRDLIATALRETEEEVGVNTNNVSVLGVLTTLYIPVSNYIVLPVLAYKSTIPKFKINKSEVEELLEVSVDHFLDAQNCKIDKIMHTEYYDVPVYDLGNHKIWGATAMILSEFIEVCKNAFKNTDKLDYLTAESGASEL